MQDYWGIDGITVCVELWRFNDRNVCCIGLLKVYISTTEVVVTTSTTSRVCDEPRATTKPELIKNVKCSPTRIECPMI